MTTVFFVDVSLKYWYSLYSNRVADNHSKNFVKLLALDSVYTNYWNIIYDNLVSYETRSAIFLVTVLR